MKWLTIDYIKTHSRIDYDCEDSLLELYGESAEQTILNIINRSYENLLEKFGTEDPLDKTKKLVPAPIIQASLMLVDTSYQYRSAITMQNLYAVPYGVDALIKPYMQLI
jgi:uncharacterized phage protein (predicted DNA packaging)